MYNHTPLPPLHEVKVGDSLRLVRDSMYSKTLLKKGRAVRVVEIVQISKRDIRVRLAFNTPVYNVNGRKMTRSWRSYDHTKAFTLYFVLASFKEVV